MPPNSTWRTPAARCLVNGEVISGLVEAEVLANNHFAADRFRAAVALDGVPPLGTAASWATIQDALIDLQFSLDGASYESLIQGQADIVEIDPVQGRLRIEGRDLTAALMESKTQDAFANQTASDIAAILAARHDLLTSITPTTTPVGRYYQNEHDRITLNQFSRAITEWDLLVFLARQEGFDVFVQGTTLFFQPPTQQLVPAFVVQPTDLTSLQLRRSLTLSRDVQVTVKSWNSRQQVAFTQTATAQGPRTGASVGLARTKPQRYTLVRPNLTPDQALQLAQRVLAEITRHERVIDLAMPGELTLSARDQLLLTGTNTDFDQIYYVDSIERVLDAAGFRQRVRARNTSPRADATVPTDLYGTGS